MPPKAEKHPKETSGKKKGKKKRKAESPLNDGATSTVVGGEPSTTKDRKVKKKYVDEQPVVASNLSNMSSSMTASTCSYNNSPNHFISSAAPIQGHGMYMYPSPLGSQSQSFGQVIGPGIGQPPPQPPPPVTPQQLAFPSPPAKPDWLTDIAEDVKSIKSGMGKIDNTVNGISQKVDNLEKKLLSIEIRVTEVEKSCNFISEQYDSQTAEISSAKKDIKIVQEQCKQLNKRQKELEEESDRLNKLDSKLLDLESRSMKENLLLFGIEEERGFRNDNNEDCIRKAQEFLCDNLEFEEGEVRQIKLDRAHRIGRKRDDTMRPVVVKFHSYGDREKVRLRGNDLREQLRRKKLAVKAQWPKEIIDKRKPLYPIFQKAKDEGKNVRFVREKLFINGIEYSQK